MGYTVGFEGPHPSELPTANAEVGSCGHAGLMDRWRGDETTPAGYVWSCLEGCGHPHQQVFYPDADMERDDDGQQGEPTASARQPDRTRCGYLIQHGMRIVINHRDTYRISRDGWSCYQSGAEMAELDSLSDGDFEALLDGMRALTEPKEA